MNFEPWQREVDVALDTICEAAGLARQLAPEAGRSALVKRDRSPVTVADFAVQALVAHRLRRAFPNDALVAEEDPAFLRVPEAQQVLKSVTGVLRLALPGLAATEILDAVDSGRSTPGERFWTLDPIDGTRGFVRGGQYAVALALVVRGVVQVGLLGCPALALGEDPPKGTGLVAVAVRNRGAFRTPLSRSRFVPLRVSTCRVARRARVLRSVEGEHIDAAAFDRIVDAAGVEASPILMDSQAKHAVIAAGEADLLVRLPARPDYREKIWDQAAGAILIEEAGGRVTDLRGARLDFGAGRVLVRNHGVIASNGHLHAEVLTAVERVLGSTRTPPTR